MENISSLYIHIPFCLSKCSYCDFFSRPLGKPDSKGVNSASWVPSSYIKALCNEILFRINKYQIKELSTIYIGGGTPSLLSIQQFTELFSFISSHVKISENTEITVEVNPDDLNKDFLQGLADCGVNRISCGIQSMNDKALKLACRRADSAANEKALSLLHDYWKGQTSLDLISGLPGDDEKSLTASLEKICQIKPAHVSLYSLTIEDETPFGKALAQGKLDYDFDRADGLWLAGRNYLEEAGYKWYEVSNFCLQGKECRHNLAYWTHASYLGCGSGASATIYEKDGSAFRWTNTCDIEKYIGFWGENDEWREEELRGVQAEERVELATSEFEFFMMSLRKLRGFNKSEFTRIFSKTLPEKFLKLFTEWEKKGFCFSFKNAGDTTYAMSRQGILFLNRFLEELC